MATRATQEPAAEDGLLAVEYPGPYPEVEVQYRSPVGSWFNKTVKKGETVRLPRASAMSLKQQGWGVKGISKADMFADLKEKGTDLPKDHPDFDEYEKHKQPKAEEPVAVAESAQEGGEA